MRIKINIQNLKCGGCAHTITTKLTELNGINNVEVHVESTSVSFNYNNDVELALVKNKLKTLGYPIEGGKNSVISKAKSFVSCATGKMSN